VSNSGAVTLGDIAYRLPMLDVACSKCDRRGRERRQADRGARRQPETVIALSD